MKMDLDLRQWKDELSFSNTPDGRHIFCYIRKRFYVSTPEELVRQLTIQYLVQVGKYAKGLINVEKGSSVNGLYRRFDIIVYHSDGTPAILIECKAPTVKLVQKTFDQVAAYNLEVKAPYLVITNGMNTYCAHINFDEKSYQMLDEMPVNSHSSD